MLTVLVFIAILSLLVLVHELGHFLVAKKMGIRVDEFGFGLPPRVFGKKIGETIYSINLFPFGGFVKLFGEDVITETKISGKDRERLFFLRPASQKALVVTAGVLMNALLAIVVFYAFLAISNFKTELPLLFNHQFFFVNQTNKVEVVITAITPGSPADSAGVREFSKVSSVNNRPIKNGKDFVNIIGENKGQEVLIVLEDLKTSQTYEVKLVPRLLPPENEGPLGVGFETLETAILNYETPGQKIFSGITHPANLMVYNLKGLGELIALSFKEKTAEPVSGAVAGPVGIFSLVGQILGIPSLKERVLQVLNFVGILSVSLAFFNILPIPALDGGRLFFIGIEATIGRPVKPKVEAIIHQIGFAALMLLILLVTYNDLLRINLLGKIRSLFP